MHLLRLASLLFFLSPLAAIAQQTATLTIDTAKPVARVSPALYGIMSEEINYSYDGGLYAEFVSNRTFQTNRGPSLEHWTLIQNGDAQANLEIDKTTGPSAALPHSLKFTVTVANREAGFYNIGFWGMASYPRRATKAPSTPNQTIPISVDSPFASSTTTPETSPPPPPLPHSAAPGRNTTSPLRPATSLPPPPIISNSSHCTQGPPGSS